MNDLSFEEFADFIRQWAGISRKKRIVPETELEDDLGITGDDGLDMLLATEERFVVSLHSEEHGFRETFNLAPNEFLFHSEGFGPGLPDLITLFKGHEASVVSFSVGDLYRAVLAKLPDRMERR